LISEFVFAKDGADLGTEELKLRVELLLLEEKNRDETLNGLVFRILSDYYLKKPRK